MTGVICKDILTQCRMISSANHMLSQLISCKCSYKLSETLVHSSLSLLELISQVKCLYHKTCYGDCAANKEMTQETASCSSHRTGSVPQLMASDVWMIMNSILACNMLLESKTQDINRLSHWIALLLAHADS